MKVLTFSFCILFCLALLACSKNSPQAQANPVVPPPTPSNTTPSSNNTPSTPSNNTANQDWSSQYIDSASQSCAAKGDPTYSTQQWYSFCSCVYQAASAQWKLSDFLNNFDQDVQTLTDNNVLANCLQTAGIVTNSNYTQSDPNSGNDSSNYGYNDPSYTSDPNSY